MILVIVNTFPRFPWRRGYRKRGKQCQKQTLNKQIFIEFIYGEESKVSSFINLNGAKRN